MGICKQALSVGDLFLSENSQATPVAKVKYIVGEDDQS
jgi:hypothetical protein